MLSVSLTPKASLFQTQEIANVRPKGEVGAQAHGGMSGPQFNPIIFEKTGSCFHSYLVRRNHTSSLH